jgi:hypothetical protein
VLECDGAGRFGTHGVSHQRGFRNFLRIHERQQICGEVCLSHA